MQKILFSIFLSVMVLSPAFARETRVKDIVAFEGIRDNILVGYGLVVGLNGTGDKLNSNAFTEQSLVSFLDRLGINTRGQNLKSRNIAAVTVTATLPGFSRQGSRIDVQVSALGDAKSLLGGTLLATPLLGADGQVYAVAQGGIAVSGFAAGGANANVTKGVPTNGLISSGAIVEREIEFSLNDLQSLNLALRNPDVTTASRIADAINLRLGIAAAKMEDPGTVNVAVPFGFEGNVATLIAEIEQVKIEPDQIAKIVIDESSGTIVMGENVRIDRVAVAQGNLIVRVDELPQVSQPGPFAPEGAETVETAETRVEFEENSDSKMTVLDTGADLKDLVSGLNALGVGPRDLISVLQTIKAAGAIHAEIQMR